MPISATIEEHWTELKKSIQVSSPEFFKLIKDVESSNINSLPDRLQVTVLKYLNRSQYRCVPFGSFSSVGTAKIGKGSILQLRLNNQRYIHKLPDWKITGKIKHSIEDILAGDYMLFCNSTYYSVGNVIRYIRRVGDKFELAEIERHLKICNILISCQVPTSISKVLNLVSEPATLFEMTNLIEDLINCGLLITELEPNLIGNDYFERIKYSSKRDSEFYLISEHKFDGGVVDQKYTRNIPVLVDLLTQILPDPGDSVDMEDFMERFSKRFDRSDIPVMVALDPELGVGYGGLHNKTNSESILGKVLGKQSNQRKSSNPSFFNKFSEFAIGETIFLDKTNIDFPPTSSKRALPNSCSLVCSVVDDNLIIERIGGHSFNQLAGRFTAVTNDILEICSEVAYIEERANPGVIFFDIAYNAEAAVDNVNRRKRLYEQELNLLNYTELQQPLTLEDLYISVSGKEIVLRSRKLNKRMVPRMSSAYNYRRSDLPVFRFLYDLSFYGIWPDLSLDPLSLIPGKQYYPRIQFRNIILSLAKIKVTKEIVAGGSVQDKVSCLNSLVTHFKLGSMVKILSGEEPLVIDCSRQHDMELLLVELQKNESIYIEEFPIPANPLIRDKQERGYINQLIIPLVHNKEVYYGSGSINNIDCGTKRAFLPGKDWISLEIYGHTSGADSILTGPLKRVLHQFHDRIKCWFFIRYNENGDHLRIRLQLKHKKFREEVMEMIHSLLEPMYNQGLLRDVSLRTYNREIERYDIAGIDKVEQHFKMDSELVIEMIASEIPEEVRYIYCLQMFLAVKEACVIGEERFDSWIENIRLHLSDEQAMTTESYKTINRYFKDNDVFNLVNHTPILSRNVDLVKSMVDLIGVCPERRKAPFLTDLMHMHINRLFADNQRGHEMIIYNLFKSYLNQAKYRSQ
ncbi:hypothetical protein D3C71_27110 [compost metagenome]